MKKAGDVAILALRIGEVIPCGVCSLGIASDIVGRYWGGEAVDWIEDAGGHECELLRSGMKPEQEARVLAIEEMFTGKAAVA